MSWIHSSGWFAVVVLVVGFCGGCQTTPRGPDPIRDIGLTELVESHNMRADALSEVWARASVQVTGTQADGSTLREQAQGHLQIQQPGKVALSLGKLGKVQLYLGSNDAVYWWIDMVDPNAKSVVVGRHELVSLDKAGVLGVPIYPRDLIGLLGITPIDPLKVIGGVEQIDGRYQIESTVEGGRFRYQFDAATLEPIFVAFVTEQGTTQVESTLDRYGYVTVVGDARSKPRIAEKVTLSLADGTVVRMSLYDPQRKPLRPAAFDLERLVRGYRIEMIYDLDAPSGAETRP